MDQFRPLMVPLSIADRQRLRRESFLTGTAPLPTQQARSSASRPTDVATLLVADPRPANRISWSHVLRDNGFGRVVEVGSVAELDTVIADGSAGDLALLSVEFGADVTRIITDLGRAGWPRILVTAPTDNPDPVIQAFRAGACGFLKGAPLGPETAVYPIASHHLSNRELMVVRLVAEGRSNKLIAQQLGVSVLTVKSHLARISRKLGTGDRAHIVAKALRAGTIR